MNLPSSGVTRTVIFGLIVVGLLVMAISGNLNPILRAVSNPFVSAQSWLSVRYMALVEFITMPRDVASLRNQNAQLQEENSRLQAQLIDLQQQIEQADVAYALLDFARSRAENQYVASTVIGRDPNPFMDYIIIDKGTDDNIRIGMPVVTEKGLVGKVNAVSSAASSVQLITDSASSVNVLLQSTQTDSILSGSSTGDVTLELVPQDVKLQVGDLVLTSGLGGSYPANIIIGQISAIRTSSNELFQDATVQPVVDFRNLQTVLIITNFQTVDISPLVPDQ